MHPLPTALKFPGIMRFLTSMGRTAEGSANPLKLYPGLGKAAAQGI